MSSKGLLQRATRWARNGRPPAAPAQRSRAPPKAGDLWALVAQSQDQGFRRFFSALAAENFAALLAAMLIVAPVDGLRPCRAARWLTLNLPKPASATSPPAASSSETTSIAVSTTCRAWLADSPLRLATCSASSFLVMPLPSRVSLLPAG